MNLAWILMGTSQLKKKAIGGMVGELLGMTRFQIMWRDHCNFVRCDNDIVIIFLKVSFSVKYAFWKCSQVGVMGVWDLL